MMIDRDIKLQVLLKDYKDKLLRSNNLANDDVKLDQKTLDDWLILTKIKSIQKTFYKITKWLKENIVKSLHGAL